MKKKYLSENQEYIYIFLLRHEKQTSIFCIYLPFGVKNE